MINNFQQIAELLTFDTPDDFYFLQIIKRRKENPDMKNGAKVIKSYRVDSLFKLNDIRSEVIDHCIHNNARAYINLNICSFQTTAYEHLREISTLMLKRNYKDVKNAYDSVCGSTKPAKNPLWLIDVDEKNLNLVSEICASVNSTGYLRVDKKHIKHINVNTELEEAEDNDNEKDIEKIDITKHITETRIKAVIETKSGYHIITMPFNKSMFSHKQDVHINSPTILFIA